MEVVLDGEELLVAEGGHREDEAIVAAVLAVSFQWCPCPEI